MTILSTFHFGGKNCISIGKYVGVQNFIWSVYCPVWVDYWTTQTTVRIFLYSGAHSEHSQTSKTEIFANKVNG